MNLNTRELLEVRQTIFEYSKSTGKQANTIQKD